MKEEQKLCLNCHEVIQGRADKKFCDDQCRSSFNNKAYGEMVSEMRTINNILRRNRRIIRELSKNSNKQKVSKDRLHEAGFNFKYHTHTCAAPRGKVYTLCYDHGYLPCDNDVFILVKWPSE